MLILTQPAKLGVLNVQTVLVLVSPASRGFLKTRMIRKLVILIPKSHLLEQHVPNLHFQTALPANHVLLHVNHVLVGRQMTVLLVFRVNTCSMVSVSKQTVMGFVKARV